MSDNKIVDNKIALVMFFAEWCGFCKIQDPIIEELRKNMGDRIEVYKVNIDENGNKDMVKDLDINGTPTLFIMKNDQIFKKYIGLTNKNELESTINNALR